MAQLTTTARPVALSRQPRSSGSPAAFSARLNGRPVRLLTYPLTRRQFAVYSIGDEPATAVATQPEPEPDSSSVGRPEPTAIEEPATAPVEGPDAAPVEEPEVTRAPNAVVKWNGPFSFPHASRAAGGGLYVVERSDGGKWIPCYVGQTKSFADRLAAHASALPKRCGPLGSMQVRLGRFSKLSSGTGQPLTPDAERRLRLAVEHVLIRDIIRQAQGRLGLPLLASTTGPLRNLSSIRPLLVGAGLSVINIGNRGIVSSTIRPPVGSLYER